MKGVTFGNYHSYDDFNLFLSQKRIGSPSPKTEYVDIPGGDGVLDLTDFFSETKYNNRQLSFDFSTNVPQSQFMELFSAIQDAIHGKKMNIVIDEDSGWYYTGRITVSEWKADKTIGMITVDCDCEPYKMKIDETVITKSVSGATSITLANSRKTVVPKVTLDSEMTIAFGTYSGTFSAGTFIIPILQLKEGNNTVTVSGSGTITFKYREGGL